MSFAIRVEGLSKRYRLGALSRPMKTLRDELGGVVRYPLRTLRQIYSRESAPTFWALSGLTLEVQQGEVLGVIGRNGAGKSTLLKILSRITDPTLGRALVRGRLASLLEVGTGFHPELSGRENIFLNATILGMRRAEITRKFDEIVAFSGIETFIDTPVKHYSSGMYVRLAFAVAAHVEAEILLVDEVLAVGDAEFQRRCLGKMGEVAKAGRTVLLVSHNLAVVRNLCTRALVFDRGTLAFDGGVGEALSNYERSLASPDTPLAETDFHGPLRSQIRFDLLQCKQGGRIEKVLDPLSDLQIELHGFSCHSFPLLDLKLSVFRDGLHVFTCHDTAHKSGMREGKFVSRIDIPGDVFRSGRYSVGIGAAASLGSWVWGSDVATLDFVENWGGRTAERSEGVVSIPYEGRRLQSQ